jgi:hypothetical protein
LDSSARKKRPVNLLFPGAGLSVREECHLRGEVRCVVEEDRTTVVRPLRGHASTSHRGIDGFLQTVAVECVGAQEAFFPVAPRIRSVEGKVGNASRKEVGSSEMNCPPDFPA